MSDRRKQLLLDIGNSRIKYALVAEPEGSPEIKTSDDLAPILALTEQVSRVHLSSVRQSSYCDAIVAHCEALQVDVQVYHSSRQCRGVQFAYENIAKLGVDRWLAVLAARYLSPKPLAVFDLGTAITCDVVIENQHQGGWICPGFQLMQDSLTRNTARVTRHTDLPESLGFGDDTEACVSKGALASVHGLVAMAEKQLSDVSTDYAILVTGGDQFLLNGYESARLQFHPNLVLVGLSLFTQTTDE